MFQTRTQTSQQEVPDDSRMWKLNNCIVRRILRKLKLSTLSESLLVLSHSILFRYYISVCNCYVLVFMQIASGCDVALISVPPHVTAKGSLCNCSTIGMTAAFTFLSPLLWSGGWHPVTNTNNLRVSPLLFALAIT